MVIFKLKFIFSICNKLIEENIQNIILNNDENIVKKLTDKYSYLIREQIELNELKQNQNNLNDEMQHAISEYLKGNNSFIENLDTNMLEEKEKSLSLIYFYKAKNAVSKRLSKSTIKKYYEKSLNIDKSFEILYSYARYLYDERDYKKAIVYYEEAFQYTNNLLYQSMIQNELGLSYGIAYGNKTATKYLLESIKLKKELVNKDNTIVNRYFLANSLNNLANNYKSLNLSKNAIMYYNKALEIFKKDSINLNEMITLNGLAKLYSQLIFYNQNKSMNLTYYKKSNECFSKSLELAMKLKNYKLIVDNYYELGKLNINMFRVNPLTDTKQEVINNLNYAMEYNEKLENNQLLYRSNKAIILSELSHYYMLNKDILNAKIIMNNIVNEYRILANIDKSRYLEEYLTQLYNYSTLRVFTREISGILKEVEKVSSKLFDYSENLDYKINYLNFLCVTKCNIFSLDKIKYESTIRSFNNEIFKVTNSYNLKYNCNCNKMRTFNGATTQSKTKL